VRFHSNEQERALLKATNSRFHAHLLSSIHTGIQMGEQYSLRWLQVDSERPQLYLSRSKNDDPLDVWLNGTAPAELDQLRSESKADLIFPNSASPCGWFIAANEQGH
jgi:hypothetical protein